MPALVADLVERGGRVERGRGMACVDRQHAALVVEVAVRLRVARRQPAVPSARRRHFDDEQSRIVIRGQSSGEQRYEKRHFVIGEPDVMDAERIVLRRAHGEDELRGVRGDRCSVRDAREHGVHVVVGDEIGCRRQHLVERRIEIRELRGEHRRLAPPSALRRRFADPTDLVDAPPVALRLAAVLHHRGAAQAEERPDL